MSGAIVRLDEEELAWLRRDVDAAAAEGRMGAWLAPGNPNTYELEEAFAGVHFILTGTEQGGDGPLGFLANEACGERVATTFAGGPGRVFEPAAVSAIADAIESLSARVVGQRLASAALRALHPFAARTLGDDDKEWLLAVLQGLMTFMRHAAQGGAAILVARL